MNAPGAGSAESGLELVGVVARSLNRGASPDDTLRSVAEQVRHGLGLESVSIWRRDPTASTFSAISSPERLQAAVTLDDLPTVSLRTVRRPLVHAGARLGMLELVAAGGVPKVSDAMLATLQNLVAPFLDAMTLAEDLALEVASRSREISEQRRFTGLVIDSLPLGIYVIDRDYRIQFWNRKRETGTQGLKRAEVVGRPVFQVLTRQPPERLKRDFDRIFETGDIQHDETVVELKGERRVYRLSRLPMRLDGEAITHVITIGEDVTDARTVERQVLQNEKLAAVGQLAAGVMHEINNPLATIATCVAAIEARLDRPANESVHEYLEIIDKEVQRCSKIVDGLLEFSRPSSARPKASLDVNALLDRTLFLLKHHKRFKRFDVRTDLAPSRPRVYGNDEQLIQVLMALLLNAVDAMADGGDLMIRTRAEVWPTEVTIEVADTGHGIPVAELRKVFEPFYSTKPAGQGTGLGLAIAYGIVSEHGGRIDVESDVGIGSRFRVILPAGPDPAP